MTSYDFKDTTSVSTTAPANEKTKHPAVCLLSGFGVIVVTGVIVHFAFRLFL